MSVMPRTRAPYPPGFRREAVQLVLAGRSVRDVAESLGCSDQSLHNWVKQHQLDSRERDDGLTSAEREEREELRELRKRVKRVEQERDILKRACGVPLFDRGRWRRVSEPREAARNRRLRAVHGSPAEQATIDRGRAEDRRVPKPDRVLAPHTHGHRAIRSDQGFGTLHAVTSTRRVKTYRRRSASG